MQRADAEAILRGWTTTEGLLRHARGVELVMRALARRFGADEEQWGIAGLLHDADYERFPDDHPSRIVTALQERGEETLAYAISAHYTKWGRPQRSALDRALLAADELSGFVYACCLVRPDGIATLTPHSVVKKLKDKAFARKVDRDEIRRGAELVGIELPELIGLVIEVFRENRDDLGLAG